MGDKYVEGKLSNRNVIEFVSLEAMVPEDHLLRKIDAVIDFDAIYDMVKDLYCEANGRPSIEKMKNPVLINLKTGFFYSL